jgi:outer membrane lipoprotein-sorting protein
MGMSLQLGVIALLSNLAAAQTPPDAKEILKSVGDTYRVTQYELAMDTSKTDSRTGQRETSKFRVALRLPDRYREWGAFPGSLGNDGEKLKGLDVAYDGKSITFYDPASNRYAIYPSSALGHTLPDDLEPDGVDFWIMSRYREPVKNSSEARLLREETIEIAGVQIPCYVVSVDKDGKLTWWVDKVSKHVLREDQDRTSFVLTTIFTTIKLGEALPDNLFKFEPPPGARKNEVVLQ